MAAAGDLDTVAVVDHRPDPAGVGGHPGQREQRVRLRGCLGARTKLRAALQDGLPQLLEDLLLQRGATLVRREHAGFVIAQGGSDESLRTHRARLALVVCGTRCRLALVTSM